MRGCLSADWTGILVFSKSSLIGCSFFGSSSFWLIGWLPFLGYIGSPSSSCFGLCVCVRVSQSCICYCLLRWSLCVGWPFASVFPVWFSFRGAAGLFLLFAAVRCFWLGCLLVFALVSSAVAGWPALSWLCLLPPHPPWLVLWRLLVQSVLCWSLPPGIWLYLQRSGCHTIGMACCD